MNTTITGSRFAKASPEKVVSHQRMIRRRRTSRACEPAARSFFSSSSAALPMSRPSVCMRTCAAAAGRLRRWRWVRRSGESDRMQTSGTPSVFVIRHRDCGDALGSVTGFPCSRGTTSRKGTVVRIDPTLGVVME